MNDLYSQNKEVVKSECFTSLMPNKSNHFYGRKWDNKSMFVL